MKTLKRLLLGLLLLLPITLVFSQPGIPILEKFYDLTLKNTQFVQMLIKYPPGIFFILSTILKIFPPSKDIYFFYNQPSWIFYKMLLLIVYYLAFLPILHLSKSVAKERRIEKIDIALTYFLSVSILIASVSLSYFDILAVPFFILSVSFMFRKKIKLSALFFILSLCFSWGTLILCPLFFLYSIKINNKTVCFLFLPVITLTSLAYQSRYLKLPNDIFNFNWFFDHPFKYTRNQNLELLVNILIALVCIIFLFYLVRKFKIFKSFIALSIISLIFFKNDLISVLSISLFLSFFWKLFRGIKSRKFTKSSFIGLSFLTYLIYILFFPFAGIGNLIWISILGLIMYITNNSKYNSILLFAVNLVVFFNYFTLFGTAGQAPLQGDYFAFFVRLLSFFFIFFCIENFESFRKRKYLPNINWLKKFIIAYIIVLNIAFIPSTGSSDMVSWVQYAQATTQYVNPFYAQTVVDQRYPPLSTAIIGVFANFWKYTIGFRPRTDRKDEPSPDYALSIKTSILAFYFLTLILFMKFRKSSIGKQVIKPIDAMLVMLTTFSLIVQTQGLADINIYTIPTLIISIILLYKRKYFLSGILLGITISIKWQPIILVPLFIATLFNIKEPHSSFDKLLKFTLGLIPIPIITWGLVLIQPGGYDAFGRAFDFLKNGAPLLSGQALNLNWIVTYFLHITKPDIYYSLSYLGGLNRQIQTITEFGIPAPFVFRGILFLLATFLILLSYWLFKKKNIVNFTITSLMIFFSHQMLNKSAYEKHIFYVVIFALLLYLIKPTKTNRLLLVLFDIMTIINLIYFYGFTGPKDINRLFFGFDTTIIFSAFYLMVYLWSLWNYMRGKVF